MTRNQNQKNKKYDGHGHRHTKQIQKTVQVKTFTNLLTLQHDTISVQGKQKIYDGRGLWHTKQIQMTQAYLQTYRLLKMIRKQTKAWIDLPGGQIAVQGKATSLHVKFISCKSEFLEAIQSSISTQLQSHPKHRAVQKSTNLAACSCETWNLLIWVADSSSRILSPNLAQRRILLYQDRWDN